MTDGARMLIGITVLATLATLLAGAGVWWFVLIEGVGCVCWGIASEISR
jgi:hypothetical protein